MGVSVRDTTAESENRHPEGDGKLSEQPTYDIGHEKQRNQNGYQRDRQRDDGERNLREPRSADSKGVSPRSM